MADPEVDLRADYRRKLMQHKELASSLRNLRENVKTTRKDFDKTENDLKASQSVGLIIGEVLRQLDSERLIVKASNGPRYVVRCCNKVDKEKLVAGTPVALDMTTGTLTIMRALPREVRISWNLMVQALQDMLKIVVHGKMVMEPIPQFQQALEVIKHVCAISSTVRAKKKQCKRLANRLSAIGEGLKDVMEWDKNFNGGNFSDGSDRNHYPALDELLIVLRKGEALVSSYVDSKSVSILVGRTDNRESFKEIHEELDTLKAQVDFESSSERGPVKDFEASSGAQRAQALTEDANLDLKTMPADMALIQDSEHTTEEMLKPLSERKARPFTRTEKLDILTQIAEGTRYLHTSQYADGDLKCSNILVKKFDDHLDVKISDVPAVGTTFYRAPEVFRHCSEARPKTADVYSFARACYEILTGN